MTIDAKMFRRRTNAKGRFIPMTKVRGFLAPLNPVMVIHSIHLTSFEKHFGHFKLVPMPLNVLLQ